MGTGRARRRRHRSGEDRISGLPDHLLHSILLRLPSTAAAARTSVLSRRWRLVWTHLPALSFTKRGHAATRLGIYDAIDAALNAYAAPALGRLEISIQDELCCYNAADRLAPWLRFASERLAGELRFLFLFTSPWISVPGCKPLKEVELPICELATAIDLCIPDHALQLPAPAAGTFAALRVLRISCNHLAATELERVVASQCPLLQDLTLSAVVVEPHGLAIRSGSLERLRLEERAGSKITVHAPRLVRFEVSLLTSNKLQGAQIAAPNLAEMIWLETFDPQCHRIVEAGRHLRSLEVLYFCWWHAPMPKMAALLQRFDTVDELHLRLSIDEKEFDYEAFRMDTFSLPQCKFLKIDMVANGLHAFEMIVSHLLRKCSSARKLHVHWTYLTKESYTYNPLSRSMDDRDEKQVYSSCGQLTTDRVALDSLEEVELSFSRVGDRVVEALVKLLLLGCRPTLRRLAIRAHRAAPALSTATREAITGFCRPETSVEFYKFQGF